MQKISKKSKEKLYKTVADQIMDARIKIAKLTNDSPKLGSAIDEVLFELSVECPLHAIDCFKYKLPDIS